MQKIAHQNSIRGNLNPPYKPLPPEQIYQQNGLAVCGFRMLSVWCGAV